MRSLVWFRRDLRVADNTALFQAAKESRDGVIRLFVITPDQWKENDDADCKVKFWLDNLSALSTELDKLRIPLRIEFCDSFSDVPAKVGKFARKHKCSKLYLNREYEVNEYRRDNDVAIACEQADIAVRRFHDRVILPPREVTTKEGKFYSMFTPYRRVWDTKALDFIDVLPKPRMQPEADIMPSRIPSRINGFEFKNFRNDLWKPGESEAQSRLRKFSNKITSYDEARDIPSVAGTSLLSPYLSAGVISPRQCLAAWKKGLTCYPIVDAGMRQLNRTGWMHNRLRMVTAMFLTKHLLIDWQWGERYFMQRLIDGDLAANNGGWQWSASTGTDSVPYFRIFNPFSQSKRFDPDGRLDEWYHDYELLSNEDSDSLD